MKIFIFIADDFQYSFWRQTMVWASRGTATRETGLSRLFSPTEKLIKQRILSVIKEKEKKSTHVTLYTQHI